MVLGPGVGYRYYLGTIVVTHANPKKKPVKHRNVPLNSLSFYVQAMVGPTMTYISEKNIESDKPKNTSLDFGGFAKGTLGFVWNDGNFLWGMGLTGGYQYWSDKARLMLNMEKFSLINGSSQKGAFFGYEIKLGF